jgi:hypothetical protein
VGTDGFVTLLAELDPGPYHAPQYAGPDVRDVREWVELCRRLHTPYYEEARLYWKDALQDGFFEGDNEARMYLPRRLKSLIEKYKNKL